MAHELETGTVDGKRVASFLLRGEPAWHGLGTVFARNRKISTEEMLREAHLADWNVRLLDVSVPLGLLDADGNMQYISPDRYVTGQRAVVRTNPFDRKEVDVLGWTGDRYTLLSNEDAFAFGDALLDGGTWETAGSIKRGTKVFGSLRMNNAPKAGRKTSVVLDPGGIADKIDNYLLVVTSHDGTAPLYAANTPVRVVCANTLNMAVKGAKQYIKIRHTASLDGKIQTARGLLGINVAYFDEFSKDAHAMIQTKITNDKFLEIVKSLKDEPADTKAAKTRASNRLDLIEAVYRGTADGPDTNSKITGTVWGAVNAVLEVEDWYRTPRGGRDESVLVGASGLDSVQNAKREAIWASFKALVPVK